VTAAKPILWHIPVSHYSEKVRWALEYKGIEHDRRAPLPGIHMLVALWLTRGEVRTFPVLRLGDRAVGDSTVIIAALEEWQPEPALYPDDPDERRRALALEDFFDEELGPHIRLLAWHEAIRDRKRFAPQAGRLVPAALRPIAGPMSSAFVRLRYRAHDDDAAQLARGKVLAALDRLEAELDGAEYLVGRRFTVADLTAAALFYPLTFPPEAPRLITEPPVGLERFRAPLKERPGYRWVEDIYGRHRKPARPPVAA
jgi:glutathione S-transferase